MSSIWVANLLMFRELCGFDIVFSYRVQSYNAPHFDYSMRAPNKFDVVTHVWGVYVLPSRWGWDCTCMVCPWTAMRSRSVHLTYQVVVYVTIPRCRSALGKTLECLRGPDTNCRGWVARMRFGQVRRPLACMHNPLAIYDSHLFSQG